MAAVLYPLLPPAEADLSPSDEVVAAGEPPVDATAAAAGDPDESVGLSGLG